MSVNAVLVRGKGVRAAFSKIVICHLINISVYADCTMLVWA